MTAVGRSAPPARPDRETGEWCTAAIGLRILRWIVVPPLGAADRPSQYGRVGMWRGGSSFGLSVAAPFVWRCPSNLAVARFHTPLIEPDMQSPASGSRTELHAFTLAKPHPRARSGVRARSARTGAREDSSRPCAAEPCACGVATDATARRCSGRARGTRRCPCLPESSSPSRATRDSTCPPAPWSLATSADAAVSAWIFSTMRRMLFFDGRVHPHRLQRVAASSRRSPRNRSAPREPNRSASSPRSPSALTSP